MFLQSQKKNGVKISTEMLFVKIGLYSIVVSFSKNRGNKTPCKTIEAENGSRNELGSMIRQL